MDRDRQIDGPSPETPPTPHWVARAAYRRGWLEQGFHTGRTLYEDVTSGVSEHAGTRLIFGSRDHPGETTVGDVHAKALRFASGLAEQGLKPGDVIVSQLPNWEEGVIALLAALHLGLVYVPVVHIYGDREMGFILEQSRAKALLIPDAWRRIDFRRMIERLGPLPPLSSVVVVGQPDGNGIAWETLDRPDTATGPAYCGAPDDVCLINFTSGTSGSPKGVLHTNESLAAEIRAFPIFTTESNRSGPMLYMVPGGHIGAIVAMLRPFLCGESAIYMDHFEADLAVELLKTHRPTRLGGVPFHLNSLFDLAGDSIRGLADQAVAGGAGVPPELIKWGERLGVSVQRAYGLTEYPTLTGCRPSDPVQKKTTTDGQPLLGAEIRLVDELGRPCAPGVPGEIEAMGPELFLGYLDPSQNAAAFTQDGWFRTGDIGLIDADGYLAIVDRKKDIIIRGGENIASRAVEDILADHPAVAEAAVVPWPDARLGEAVGAFVRLKPGANIDLTSVQAHFRAAGSARNMMPEHLVCVDDFPRTPLGKIQKAGLRPLIPLGRAE